MLTDDKDNGILCIEIRRGDNMELKVDGNIILIDDEDYIKIKDYNWRVYDNGYAQDTVWDKYNKICKTIKMHRIIMDSAYGDLVDHKNHNKLDNRKENLRTTNHGGNNKNKKKQFKDGVTSKYKGVSKNGDNWEVKITNNNISIYLGVYSNEEVAGHVYNMNAEKLHGEFAYLNNVEKFENWLDFKLEKGYKTSKYNGVCFIEEKNMWLASISINGKSEYIGCYKDEISCANAYNSYASKLGRELNDVEIVVNFENNRVAKRIKSSKTKGISFHKGTKKWRARFRFEYVDFNLGLFNTEEEAMDAMKNKKRELGAI